jgi:hypothetical protein
LRTSINQANTQRTFESSNRLGHRWLGQVQVRGRLCHAAVLRHGAEEPQVAKLEAAKYAVVDVHGGPYENW